MENLIPEYHRVIEGVGLADACEAAPLFFRGLEGIADDPLTADAGKDAVLDHHFVGLSLKQPASASRVLALAVFADEGHVDVLPSHIL